MATIKRGVVKAFDAGTRQATVQIAGSLGVWLEGVPVATGIAAADLAAGVECGVIFFTDDNQADAAVVSVHNVADPPGQGRIRDTDNDTRWEAEASPDEDKLRGTIAGTLRYLMQGSSVHHQLTGDASVSGRLLVGPNPGSAALVDCGDGNYTGSTGKDGMRALIIQKGSTGSVRGVVGEAQAQTGAGALSYIRGLEFRAGHSGANTVTDLLGITTNITGTGPATNRIGYLNLIQALNTSPTLQAAFVARVEALVNTTWNHYYGYKSEATIGFGTVTDFYHYAVTDLSVAFGGTATRLYGFYVPPLIDGVARRPFWEEGVNGATGDGHGNRFRSNTAFGTIATATLFGGGDGVIHIANAPTAPTANPAGGGILYAAAGGLYWRGSGGTVTNIAPA